MFSGLAFAGLIYTIFLQRKELALQRKELRLQREEMAKSREELAKQVAAQRAQRQVSIALLKVEGLKAEIAAQEMSSAQYGPGGRDDQIKAIRSIATRIEEIANSPQNETYG